MPSLAVLQPELTDTITLYSSYTTNGYNTTIGNILSKVRGLGTYDSFFIFAATGGTVWKGLSVIVPFNVGTREDYYIADGEYCELSGIGANNVALAYAQNIGNPGFNGGYIMNGSGNLQKVFNSMSFQYATKEGKQYCGQSSPPSDDTLYSLVYIGATITNLYINGALPVLYQWSSVPAISGKNGILLPMSTLNDINDGNEVTTSDTSKFNLNDRSNIKSLVDAVVNDF